MPFWIITSSSMRPNSGDEVEDDVARVLASSRFEVSVQSSTHCASSIGECLGLSVPDLQIQVKCADTPETRRLAIVPAAGTWQRSIPCKRNSVSLH